MALQFAESLRTATRPPLELTALHSGRRHPLALQVTYCQCYSPGVNAFCCYLYACKLRPVTDLHHTDAGLRTKAASGASGGALIAMRLLPWFVLDCQVVTSLVNTASASVQACRLA